MAKGGGGKSFSGASSGIFGGVTAGSTMICKAEDNSWYCVLTKFFTLFFQIITFIITIYILYVIVYPMAKKWASSRGK